MSEQRLTGQFPRPREGEYIPITFIEFKRKLAGWSPELKRSIYTEREEETARLKRIREVNMMLAINNLSGRLSSIELTDEEKIQFEEVYDMFLKRGGQLVYTRKKTGTKKLVSIFEVRSEDRGAIDMPEKSLLSERI